MPVIDVVKWNAAPDELVWKFPSDQLSTATRLIVSTSQEAIVILGGEISAVFGPGTHILDTGNIPLLRTLINIPFGGQTPFSAEVWFVQKTAPLNLLWGTSDPVPLLDPKFQIPVSLRGFGQFGIQIEDSRLFVEKLVGTYDSFNTAMICEYFKAMVQTKVKTILANKVAEAGCSIFEINQQLDTLSQSMANELVPAFKPYGVKLTEFFIQSVNFPKDDPAIIALSQSLAKKADMTILNYNYTQERSFDVLQGAAENEGAGGAFAAAGMGLGMGVAAGGAVAPAMMQAANGLVNISSPANVNAVCFSCRTPLPSDARFCPGCGTLQRPVCCGTELPPGTNFCPRCGKDLRK